MYQIYVEPSLGLSLNLSLSLSLFVDSKLDKRNGTEDLEIVKPVRSNVT